MLNRMLAKAEQHLLAGRVDRLDKTLGIDSWRHDAWAVEVHPDLVAGLDGLDITCPAEGEDLPRSKALSYPTRDKSVIPAPDLVEELQRRRTSGNRFSTTAVNGGRSSPYP